MAEKHDIVIQMLKIVDETRKKTRPPLGRNPGEPAERPPVGKAMWRPPIGLQKSAPGRPPVGASSVGKLLRTQTELASFSREVNRRFGVKVAVSRSTKLSDLASTIHSMMDIGDK